MRNERFIDRRHRAAAWPLAAAGVLLAATAALASAPPQPAAQVIVKLRTAPVRAEDLDHLARQSGCSLSLLRPLATGAALVLLRPAQCLPRLRALPEVRYAVEDRISQPQ